MEIQIEELTEAMSGDKARLWRFIRMAEGIFAKVERRSQFHEDVYRMACAVLLSEKYSNPTPENVRKCMQESARREREKPLDAGFALLSNSLLYVFGGSMGYVIPEDNPQRPETLQILRVDFPDLRSPLDPNLKSTFDSLKIA